MQFDCECGLATAYEDPPECPECGKRMKHLRLEVLEREHSEFFERWHDERRKREALERAIFQHQADVRYATQGAALSLADDALYKALKVGDGRRRPRGTTAK